jgi:hypothetical protein
MNNFMKLTDLWNWKSFQNCLLLYPQANGAERRSGRKARGEGTNSARLFTPRETKALAKSKVHQWLRAWVSNSVEWVVILTDLKICSGLSWIANTDWLDLKFCCCVTNDDSEIRNISCKSANILYFCKILQISKPFLSAKNRLKTSKRMEQSRRAKSLRI